MGNENSLGADVAVLDRGLVCGTLLRSVQHIVLFGGKLTMGRDHQHDAVTVRVVSHGIYDETFSAPSLEEALCKSVRHYFGWAVIYAERKVAERLGQVTQYETAVTAARTVLETGQKNLAESESLLRDVYQASQEFARVENV